MSEVLKMTMWKRDDYIYWLIASGKNHVGGMASTVNEALFHLRITVQGMSL